MKGQPQPNPLRAIAFVAGLTFLGVCSKDISNLAGKACTYIGIQSQPIAEIATSVFREVRDSGKGLDGEYSRLTNVVAQVDLDLRSSAPNAKDIARARARTYFNSNGFDGSTLARLTVNPPVPGTKDHAIASGVSRLLSVADYK